MQKVKNRVKGIIASIPVKLNWVVTFKRTLQAMGGPVSNSTSLTPTTIPQITVLICHMSQRFIAKCFAS